MLKKITNVGDCGISCDFGEEVTKNTNTEVIKLLILFKILFEQKKLRGFLIAPLLITNLLLILS